MNVWNNFSLHIDTFSVETFAFFFCVIIFSSLPKKGDRVETVSFDLCYYFYSKEYHGTDPKFLFPASKPIQVTSVSYRFLYRDASGYFGKFRSFRPKY